MNKKTKLLMISMLSLGLCTSMVFVFGNNMVDLVSANRDKPANMECSYYFNNSEYTSLYDLNASRIDGGTDISNMTTWGTVTCNYLYLYKGTNYNCSIIQSTDKYGNHGATVLYGIASTYDVGSVVSVTGTVTLYDGMSEMKNCTVTKDYDSNPSPVEPLELTEPLPENGDSDYNYYRYMGTREVVIKNVRLSYSASNKSYVYFNDTDKIELFYGSNTKQSLISNVAQNLDNKYVNIHGYLNCYNYKNLSTNTSVLQVILRSVDDIEEVDDEKVIDYLEVSTDKSFYYMDTIKMSDFTATVYYTDGTSSLVTTAYITNTVDTSSTGQKLVEFAYEKDGETYTDSMWIIVNDTISSLEIVDPVIYYAYNEEFITPTVYGHSYSYEPNLTSEVEFSGFDPYWESEYHSQVFVDYTNSAGKQLTTSYTYYVSSVETLFTVNAKTEFDLGEAFDYPAVYANFKCAPDEDIDVSNRVTFSGFDSSTPGSVDVTFSFGDFSDTYEVEIIDTTPAELYEYNVSISGIGKYETGNYGKSGDFEYYRAVQASGYICKLIPLEQQPGCEETLGGALYNVDPIKDIDHITFTYKTNGNGTRNAKLYCGENTYDDCEYVITSSTTNKETTIDLSSKQVNYFKFDSGDITLFLQSITVYYSGLNTTNGSNFTYKTTGTNEYRIAPTTYSGTLEDGVSYVDVPTSINTSTGAILSTKRYTYYSYDYVEEHQEYISEATIIDPVDVCNYFEAFGVCPANYGGSFGSINGISIATKEQVNSLFGSDARCISKYSKTTGYATSVPYYGSKPTYYELDIDTNGQYSTSSRQVGRIVAWATGFTGSDYGNGSQCVCVYTDDHYATFKEYNNFGGFLSRFNVERKICGAVRGNPTTLTY